MTYPPEDYYHSQEEREAMHRFCRGFLYAILFAAVFWGGVWFILA